MLYLMTVLSDSIVDTYPENLAKTENSQKIEKFRGTSQQCWERVTSGNSHFQLHS